MAGKLTEKNAYEDNLAEYEKSAIYANIWNSSLTPLYRIISMMGILFILYFGSRNVLGTGWRTRDIAAFTTFLACFIKLSDKSSKAAKLFNAVHKAQVSWKRIKPLMVIQAKDTDCKNQTLGRLEVQNLSFTYPDGKNVYNDISFTAEPGQIIGVLQVRLLVVSQPLEGHFCVNIHMREVSDITDVS